MKTLNTIYILFFFLFTGQSNGQIIYERTYPNDFPSIQIPIELSDTSTFSLGNNSECGGLQSRHIDAKGNDLQENIFYSEVFSSGHYWIGHDSVLIWVEYGAYDVGPDSFQVYIWTPGERKKIMSIGIGYGFTPSQKYGAYLYTADRLVYEKWDTLYTINLITSVDEESLIFSDILNIIEFEKSILVFSDDEKPLVLNDRLEIIHEWENMSSLPFNINEAVVLDSFLVGKEDFNPLSLGMVNVYNESLSHLDLSSYFDLIEDIQSNKNYLFVKGTSNGAHFVLQLDHRFEFVDLTMIAFPDLDKPLTFQYYPDRVYAWGFDGLANYKANYRMSYPYVDANPIKYLDIALDTMWVDSVYKYPEEYHLPARVYISASIRNLSPEPIHSFILHWEETPVFWCDPGVYPWPMEGMNVEPGAVDTVSFQTWSYSLAHGSPYIEWFFVQHGNHHFDDDVTNNSFQLIHIISNSGGPVPSFISVFPNPFTDFLRLSNESDALQISLYDQTGRMVSSGYGQLDDLGGLPAGIYSLQIMTGHFIDVKRVVKVE